MLIKDSRAVPFGVTRTPCWCYGYVGLTVFLTITTNVRLCRPMRQHASSNLVTDCCFTIVTKSFLSPWNVRTFTYQVSHISGVRMFYFFIIRIQECLVRYYSVADLMGGRWAVADSAPAQKVPQGPIFPQKLWFYPNTIFFSLPIIFIPHARVYNSVICCSF